MRKLAGHRRLDAVDMQHSAPDARDSIVDTGISELYRTRLHNGDLIEGFIILKMVVRQFLVMGAREEFVCIIQSVVAYRDNLTRLHETEILFRLRRMLPGWPSITE